MSRRKTVNVSEKEDQATEVEQAAARCKDLAYGCSKCGTLLAFVDDETRSNIRIKHRDLYIFVKDPQEFVIICRGCGEINRLNYVSPEMVDDMKEAS